MKEITSQLEEAKASSDIMVQETADEIFKLKNQVESLEEQLREVQKNRDSVVQDAANVEEQVAQLKEKIETQNRVSQFTSD